jgi:hypothetical protein
VRNVLHAQATSQGSGPCGDRRFSAIGSRSNVAAENRPAAAAPCSSSLPIVESTWATPLPDSNEDPWAVDMSASLALQHATTGSNRPRVSAPQCRRVAPRGA